MRSVLLLALLLGFPAVLPAAPVQLSGPAKAPARAKFTFVAYGDTRTDAVAHRAVIAEIIKLKPEFVLQSGDLVARGSSAAQWEEFDEITAPLRAARIAYYPARGNHDEGGTLYEAHVREPFDSGNKNFYAVTRHRCRFIIVDEYQEYGPGSLQYRWLENEMARARKSAVNTFVLMHEAPWSVGPHGPNEDVQQRLHPLFVRFKPRVVFCGHDHLYYRTVRDGVPYVVSGGGGAPLYAPVNRKVALAGDVYASAHHVVKCDVDGGRVTLTALTPDGRVLDKFTVGTP